MTSAIAIFTGNLSAEKGTKLEIPGAEQYGRDRQ